MANWCSNKVEFIGESSQIEQLASLFNAMAANEKKNGCGQMPEFVPISETKYFFSISWENGILYYETKWSPNTSVLQRIAMEYGVGFIHSYDEPGNAVYGEAHYLNDELTVIDLDWDDIGQYEYDEENGIYRFENRNYESSDEILYIMLQRKKAAIRQQNLNPTDNNPSETF
ncbi:hypothetical protein D0C36_19460 [Mucilaginibacter conchicola]|uniref:YubB ferredoxin-like domain-containing protein n=1 Tax=Mucilaginibacter conchicola TaxID=2303333 RepID=A0A372NQB2_9SPHI|nr:hypothetical protein [Mucilaginibacter conchicola]RFZ91121.1 hypothetical protein D0C36_19460 [Mucilaginibacter conchicola]